MHNLDDWKRLYFDLDRTRLTGYSKVGTPRYSDLQRADWHIHSSETGTVHRRCQYMRYCPQKNDPGYKPIHRLRRRSFTGSTYCTVNVCDLNPPVQIKTDL